MTKFSKYVNIDGFTVEGIDITTLEKLDEYLPTNGVIDLNIARNGLIMTLHAEIYCQEVIIKLERYLSVLEGEKSKAWANAVLNKAAEKGLKTDKSKEWFAEADDDYIEVLNKITIAKTAKKWFDNKASNLRGWHYTFKSLLKREYDLENTGNLQEMQYNIDTQNKESSDSGFDVSNGW